ncbi:MAG: sensor histidine kinase [Caldilineaceae bacterium]|nr:sensor histidine kinase [Caldilineaceae bacterium]
MSTNPQPELLEAKALQAAAEERKRIARELHDSLGYALTISMVQLENAAELISEEPLQAREIIETVRGQLSSGVDDLRLTLTTLRNNEICVDNLLSTLQRLISEFAAATGIIVQTRFLKALPHVSDAHATAVFRAVQEALINSFKHGEAKNVSISLDVGDSSLTLHVKDDGQRVAASARGGFGLLGVKERADALGGTLLVIRRPEGGVAVTLDLPLKGEVNA